MSSGGPSRDAAVIRNLEDFRDVIEFDPPPVQTPPPESNGHARGLSESQNLLSNSLPNSPPAETSAHSRGISESQNLLPNAPQNLFEYSSTRGIRGYGRPDVEGLAEGERIIIEKSGNGRVSPHWSGIPQNLRRTQREKWGDFVVDFLAIFSTLPFFALAGAMLWFDGKEFQEHQLYVLDQCAKVGATLFPICFSLIVGRAMVKIASWKLEQGTTLGLLEQLMNSQTVGRTLITQFRLWAFSFVSCGLIILWLLSPIASQSILRAISVRTAGGIADLSINYVNTRGAIYSSTQQGVSWWSGYVSLFGAAILAPETVKNGSMDLWGNVKIPTFSSLSDLQQEDDGWRKIPKTGFTPVYSSLFGIPVSNLVSGNTNFSIESTYMELTCSNLTTAVARNNGIFFNPGLISTTGPFRAGTNLTSTTPWAIGYLGDDQTSLLPNSSVVSLTNLANLATVVSNSLLPGLLLYQDFTGHQNVTSIYCVPAQIYVESSVDCTKSSNTSTPSCTVTRQRLSTLKHIASPITLLSFRQALTSLTSLLPISTQQFNHIDLLQNYLVNPFSNTFISETPYAGDSGQESRFLTLPMKDFSSRLSQVLNTFFLGSMMNSSSYLTHQITPTTPVSVVGNPDIASQLNTVIPVLRDTASQSATIPAFFSTSDPYIAFFLIATITMLFAGVAAALLSRMTKARQYLGYVSSIFRESEKTEFPRGAVNVDGIERTRMMRNFRVRLGDIGDVEGGWEIGTGVVLRVGRLGVGREGEIGPLDRKGGGLYL